MKSPRLIHQLLLLSTLLLAFASGCTTPEQNPIHSVTLNGGGNAQTQDWNAGITITFKTPPPAFVITQLEAAKANRSPINYQLQTINQPHSVWTIRQTRALDPAPQRAIAAALTVPGTVVTHAP